MNIAIENMGTFNKFSLKKPTTMKGPIWYRSNYEILFFAAAIKN